MKFHHADAASAINKASAACGPWVDIRAAPGHGAPESAINAKTPLCGAKMLAFFCKLCYNEKNALYMKGAHYDRYLPHLSILAHAPRGRGCCHRFMKARTRVRADKICRVAEGTPPPSFNLTSALHHVSGAVSSTYESNEGLLAPNAFTAEGILDHHYCLFEAMFGLAWRE